MFMGSRSSHSMNNSKCSACVTRCSRITVYVFLYIGKLILFDLFANNESAVFSTSRSRHEEACNKIFMNSFLVFHRLSFHLRCLFLVFFSFPMHSSSTLFVFIFPRFSIGHIQFIRLHFTFSFVVTFDF